MSRITWRLPLKPVTCFHWPLWSAPYPLHICTSKLSFILVWTSSSFMLLKAWTSSKVFWAQTIILGANNYFFFKIHFCNFLKNLWIFSTILQGIGSAFYKRFISRIPWNLFSPLQYLNCFWKCQNLKEIITLGRV